MEDSLTYVSFPKFAYDAANRANGWELFLPVDQTENSPHLLHSLPVDIAPHPAQQRSQLAGR
jgi:hypothetical protein